MLASQFAWALPLALLGLVLAFWPRPQHAQITASLALWGLWVLSYGLVFGSAGGIFHAYYLSTMAPALAALAGVACVELWRRGARALVLGLALSAAWQIWITGDSLGWRLPWLALRWSPCLPR